MQQNNLLLSASSRSVSPRVSHTFLTYFGICFWVFSLFASWQANGAEPISLTSAQYLISDSESIPDESALWQPIELPYITAGTPFADRPMVTWFKFKVEPPSEFYALYLYRYQTKAKVFLNKHYVGGDVEPAGWMVTAWNHPLLVSLPSSEWAQSDNHLYIRLVGGDLGPLMAPPVFGSQLELHEQWQDRMFWQVQSSKMSFLLCLVLAVLTFWFWRLRPDDWLYLKFTGACLSWAIVDIYLIVTHYPIGLAELLVFVHSGIDFACFFFIAFINQAVSLRADRVEKGMLYFCLTALACYVVVPLDYFLYVAYATHIVNLLLLIYIFVRAVFVIQSEFSPSKIWIPLAFLGILTLGLHDVYTFLFAESSSWIKASHIAQFTPPLILLCLFAHLGQRFILALDDVETLNLEMEDRVKEKRRELEKIYEQSRDLELKQSALREREKIYRDLHDDVGSKLVSIIQSTGTEKNPTLARAALESLRAAIFRAKYPDLDLATLLADCQEETGIRTDAIGLKFAWQQNTIPAGLKLESGTSYHLIRIFREAITNALHQETEDPLSISVEINEELHFSLSNGSNATEPAVSKFGSGLANITFRAEEIGARVDWRQNEGFMIFDLWLPLEQLTLGEPSPLSV